LHAPSHCAHIILALAGLYVSYGRREQALPLYR
jgi:hypothetical protein